MLVVGLVGVAAGPASASSDDRGGAVRGERGDGILVGCGQGHYKTIGAAVSHASSGDTIVVCPGTYHENVVVPADKQLTLRGLGHAVIDASGPHTGAQPGIQVLSSHSVVSGFTVKRAFGEGILVGYEPVLPGTHPLPPAVSGVTISGNVVVDNDQGNPTNQALSASPYSQCIAQGPVPGDCGEGIHLLSATDSTVTDNRVSGNSGGILLTDENGPASGNVVSDNQVTDNVYDCGITVAGHNIKLAGGVFDNRFLDNRVSGNGTKGQGAGILFATPVPGDASTYGVGGAVYDNFVAGNVIWGNGLAGVTVHSHAPGQDLNGNVIVHNFIGTNNLAPDEDFGPAFVDAQTTGVIVTAVSDVSITVAHNVIARNENGVWLGEVGGAAITATGLASNAFFQVTNHVVTVP